MKERLDVLLVKQGLAESREKAKAVIMAGEVFVQGQREDKAGAMFDESKVTITVKGSSLRYVSRGGLKLEKAMACFPITLEGDICMDIGSSTGGFTDCMLQNGAKKGLFRRCRTRSARVEAAAGRARCLHGKDEFPVSDEGSDCG